MTKLAEKNMGLNAPQNMQKKKNQLLMGVKSMPQKSRDATGIKRLRVFLPDMKSHL